MKSVVGVRQRPSRAIGYCLALLLTASVLTGCGCGKNITGPIGEAFKKPEPRDGAEPALLLLYMDDSASMDEDRDKYGEWAIRLLRSIGAEDASKVGVHFSTFRSNVIGASDLKLTGKSAIEKKIIDYEDAHKKEDASGGPAKQDNRDLGTSLKEVLKDAYKTMEASKASSALIAIFCDGGVEDGKNGDLAGALAAAKRLEHLPGSVKNVKVLMLGLSEDNNGALIRAQEDFWSKVNVPQELGKMTDVDAIITKEATAFGETAK